MANKHENMGLRASLKNAESKALGALKPLWTRLANVVMSRDIADLLNLGGLVQRGSPTSFSASCNSSANSLGDSTVSRPLRELLHTPKATMAIVSNVNSIR